MNSSSTNNSFIKLTETAAGRVGIKLQLNQFNKDSANPNYYGKVERYTLSVQNILDGIAGELPQIDTGTAASVLNAYANVMLKSLKSGNAVKFGELGTFYIASKGVVDSATGRPSLTVKFTPNQILKDAVANIEIASSEYKEASGLISLITDVATGRTDGTLTTSSSILVEGYGIKVGGESSGIWFAAASTEGELEKDESKWIPVTTALTYNTPSKLLFALPSALSKGTSYKIVIRTKCAGRSGYERKSLVETVSDSVTIV